MINKIYTYIKEYIKQEWKFYLFLLIFFLFMTYHVPYGVEAPGGIKELNNRIENKIYDSKGSFNSTYVTYLNGTPAIVLLSYIIPDWDLQSISEVVYDNETIKDSNLRDKIYLKSAISSAQFLSYSKAGITPDIKKKNVYIIYVDERASSDIKVGDILLEINSNKMDDSNEVLENIDKLNAGDEVTLKVLRNGKEKEVTSTLFENDGEVYVGISILEVNEYNNKEKIGYKLDRKEAGPSGGLMMSLAMYNSLIEEDITKGLKICGTGTISHDGTVGSIGGVKYKLLGAKNKKCDVFLIPTDNYEEAKEIVDNKKLKIKLIEAKNFDQVLESIDKLKGK